MNILIGGYKNSGKTRFARYFCEAAGITFHDTSTIVLNKVYAESDFGFRDTFETFEAFVAAKDELRPALYDAIRALNKDDDSRIAAHVLNIIPVYVGMRSHEEFYGCVDEGLFGLTVWIDRGGFEGKDSCTVSESDFDIIVENIGSIPDLKRKAQRLGKLYFRNRISAPS